MCKSGGIEMETRNITLIVDNTKKGTEVAKTVFSALKFRYCDEEKCLFPGIWKAWYATVDNWWVFEWLVLALLDKLLDIWYGVTTAFLIGYDRARMCLGMDILPHIMKFCESNIKEPLSEAWKWRKELMDNRKY